MRTLLLVAALLAVVALTAPTAAQPAGDPVPKILEVWRKRQTAFKTVKYVVTGKVEHLTLPSPRPGAEKQKANQPKLPLEIPFRAVVLIDCRTTRFRLDVDEFIWSSRQQTLVANDSARAFDGERMHSAIRNGKEHLGTGAPDVVVVKGELSGQQVSAELWPIFEAHGIIPTAQNPLRPDKPPVNFTPEMFQRRGQLVHAKATCEVLNTEPLNGVPVNIDEFWVEVVADGFIRRHTYYSGRNPFIRLDVNPQVKSGGNIPKDWTCTWTEGNRTRAIHRLTVESFEGDVAVSDADFRIVPKRGSTVEEHTMPAPGSGLDPVKHAVKKYTVNSSGSTNLTETSPQRQLDGSEASGESQYGWLWWVGGIVLVALASVVVIRWKRKR